VVHISYLLLTSLVKRANFPKDTKRLWQKRPIFQKTANVFGKKGRFSKRQLTSLVKKADFPKDN